MISTWICFGVIQLVYSQVNITLDSFIGSTYQPLANRDVRLNCTAPGPCCQSSTREWAVERNGGFTIIYRDNTNNYPLKYAEDLQESLNQFNLIITNFDVDSDLTRYRCRYGFESSFYTLTMDEGLHYIPSEDEIEQKRNFTKGNIFSYAVNITRTYPLPNCSCTYGDDDLTSLMESTSGDNGVLKFLVLSLTNAVHECVGEFTIKCDIGFYQDQNIVRFMPCTSSTPPTTFGKTTTPVQNECALDGNISKILCISLYVLIPFMSLLFIVISCILYKRYKDKDDIDKYKTPKSEIVVPQSDHRLDSELHNFNWRYSTKTDSDVQI